MKLNERLKYFLLTLVTIGLGLLSRTSLSPEFLLPYLGDILYSVMIFFMLCILFPTQNKVKIAIASTLICFGIEISQLYQAEWINAIRSTTLGKLTLGRGFLWSDLVCYSVGGVVGVISQMRVSNLK